MFQLVAFAVAIIGCAIASYWDLKTTEVPDMIPYTMGAIGLATYAVQSMLVWSLVPLFSSIIAGTALFVFGYVMYYFGVWGGADAKLLAAIGFLLPSISELSFGASLPKLGIMFPFPATYTTNVFVVGTVYMLLYASVMAFRNRKIIQAFKKDLRKSSKVFFATFAALFMAFVAIDWMLYVQLGMAPDVSLAVMNSVLPLAATMSLFVIYKFARAVEDVGFKKRIPVKKLRVGDMLMKTRKLEGLTQSQVRRIKKSKMKYVWIKDGIRFIPAFPLALLFTIYYGDAILFLFRLLI